MKPDMKGGIENVGLLESVQLNLTVTHLIVHTLKIIIQLQLLSLKLAVLLLIPETETDKDEGIYRETDKK